ncbi:MAG: hypothetical protein AB7S75_03545 [Desulfococcaceae bacterium]
MNQDTDNSRQWILPAILLLFFLAAGILLLRNAPLVRILQKIEINGRTEPGEFILGRENLGQNKGPRSAEDHHLKIRFIPQKPQNIWEISNIARHRRVDVKTDRHSTLFLKRWELKNGDLITLGKAEMEVIRADTVLELRERKENRTLVWKSGKLHFPEGEKLYDAHWSFWDHFRVRLRYFLMQHFDRGKNREIRIFSLGGGVNCPDLWKLAGANMPESLFVYQYQEKFFIGPGNTDTPVHMTRPGQSPLVFSQMPLRLKGEKGTVERVILGRTYYDVKFNEHVLQLIPIQRTDVQPWDDPLDNKDSEIRYGNITLHYSKNPMRMGEGKSFFPAIPVKWLISILAAGLILTALAYSYEKTMQRFRAGSSGNLLIRVSAVLSAALMIPLTLLIWPVRADTSLSFLLLMLWISWAWTSIVMLHAGYLNGLSGRLWNTALFLAGAGTLILTQLALGADNLRWSDAVQKHAVLLSIFAWIMLIFALISIQKIMQIWIAFSAERTGFRSVPRIVLMILGTALLLMQLGFGSEQGFGGIQPAELAKILLVFTAAFTGMHLAELRQMDSQQLKSNPGPLIFGFLKFLLLITVTVIFVLVGVRDISPMLIMGIFMLSWLWEIAPHPWKDRIAEHPQKTGFSTTITFRVVRGFVLFLILGTILTILGIFRHPDWMSEDFPHQDRFRVWAQPQLHPHTGEQVIQAMKRSGQGRWLGTGFAGQNGPVMNLPVVQNDFIGVFVFYKFGGLAGMLLMLVHAAYILTLFECAGQIRLWRENVRDYNPRRAGHVLELILYGMAWMHITHWFIAWSNALGLLPVMGQPMTWIAAANSHLFFFGMPALALGMMAGRWERTGI